MFAPKRLAPLVLLTVAIAVAACGGASAAAPGQGSDDVPAASAQPAAAAATEAAPAGDPASADRPVGDAYSASSIVVTGAEELQMKTLGVCGMNPLFDSTFDAGFDNTAPGFEFFGDDLFVLEITIDGYDGAGTYETARDSHGKAGLHLTDMMGTSYDAQSGDTVTIDAGERSGSLDATLVDDESGDTVEVTGAFTCEPA